MTRHTFARLSLVIAAVVLVATSVTRAQQPQQPAAPAGPLAPQKYKDIQVLKDIPADQLDVTMRYFVAATGLNCSNCHMRDQATGVFTYEADTRAKTTARNMIKIVQTVNAGDFGAQISCGTCHQGRNRPAGLTPALMMTPDQLAAAAAQAARQGGPPPPQGGAAAAAGQPAGAGRGAQPAAPAVDDVLNKYIAALGGQAAVEKLQSRVITGTYVNRATQSIAFTIEEKGAKYRESSQLPGAALTYGFDGTAGWLQSGTNILDMSGFQMAQATRLNDLPRLLHIKDRYQNVTAGRPTTLPAATPGGTPTSVNLIQGSIAPNVTERFYFDATSGLLVRHQVITRTPQSINGVLTETIDYSNYKPVAGVMMPFTIIRNNWNTLDTMTVTDVKANAAIDDARFSKPKG
jgi:photosynthetic reaction center cytochrome c subunit